MLDCALLFEMKMDDLVEESWLVSLDKETQIKRIMARDELSKDDAKKRIEAQMPLEEKVERTTRIIDNSSAVNETHKQVMDIWDEAVREEKKNN